MQDGAVHLDCDLNRVIPVGSLLNFWALVALGISPRREYTSEADIAIRQAAMDRYVMLVRVPYDRTAQRVAALLAGKMQTLPEALANSITWDQGKEMAEHASFTVKTGIDVYFCDPHSPWQRGSNENTVTQR